MDSERIIKISDPVYAFNEAVSHIDLNQYFAHKERKTGRPEYDREALFKLVLFAFMEFGYCSVRQLRKLCDTDIRFHFLRTAPVKGNQYGRTEEFYQCEDCEGCTHREKCHKSQYNRTITASACAYIFCILFSMTLVYNQQNTE